MGVNLDGMCLCIMEALKRMKQDKSKENPGVILCTASTNGMEGHPFYTDYNASKAAVINLRPLRGSRACAVDPLQLHLPRATS